MHIIYLIMSVNMLVEQLNPCLPYSAPMNAKRLFTTHQQIAEVLEVGCVSTVVSTVLQLLPERCGRHKHWSLLLVSW